MARTWMILGRVIRVVPAQPEHAAVEEADDAAQAETEQAAHAAVEEADDAAQAEAEQAAHAAVEEADDAAQAQGEHAAQAEAEQAAVGDAEDAAQEQLAAAAAAEAEVAAARAELEESVVQVDAVPAAEANNLGEPGFTISVAPPPLVTFFTARDSSQADTSRRDMYPYIIAAGPFCLLAHFAMAPYYGTDTTRILPGGDTRERRTHHHLIVVRHFRRTGGEIVATAVRVPARPLVVPALTNIESVGLVFNGDNYTIAELMVNTGRRPSLELVIFRSDLRNWFSTGKLQSPLADWDRSRRWVPHGAVAVHSMVMWFDLSWGILTCDTAQQQPEAFEVSFYRLPRGRGLRKGKATDDIHDKRCIAVSRGFVRYVEIISVPDPGSPNVGAARVCMWSLRMDGEGWRWIANYSVAFDHIWKNHSYGITGLQQSIPVLAGVCPANPDVVYFDLDHRLFGVNVPECRVVDYETDQHELVNMPLQPQTMKGSSRYLLNWNLLPPGEPMIGHVSPDLPQDDGFAKDKEEEPKDRKGKSKATGTGGRRAGRSSRPSKALRIG